MTFSSTKEKPEYKRLRQRKNNIKPHKHGGIACSKNRRAELTKAYNEISNQEINDIMRTVKTLRAMKLK